MMVNFWGLYSAERRDILVCTTLTTKRFPKAQEMSRRQMPRAEGNLEAGRDIQPILSS